MSQMRVSAASGFAETRLFNQAPRPRLISCSFSKQPQARSAPATSQPSSQGQPSAPTVQPTLGTDGRPVPIWDFTQYIQAEERTKFGVEQLRFLARKRRFKAGEGPAMPEESTCPGCTGSGMVMCHECKGAAVNDRDMESIMKNNMENIVAANNGVVNVFWYFQKGGPCWYCRGDPNCPCRDCEGTGITGFRSINYNGD